MTDEEPAWWRAHRSTDPADLIELLDDPENRWAAARRVGELGYAEATPKLIKLLRAGDPHLRCAAAVSLGELRAPDAVEPLVELALTDDEGYVRSWAISALGSIGDASVTERLRPLLDVDLKPSIAYTTAVTLASLGDPVGSERLEAHYRSERWTLPSLRKTRAVRPPSLLVWFALVACWLAGTAALLRFWDGWPLLVLIAALVFAMEEAWLAARNAAARRAGVFRTSGFRDGPTADVRVGAIALAVVWTAVLALLFSFGLAYLGVYVSSFFLIHRVALDRDERRRTRRVRT